MRIPSLAALLLLASCSREPRSFMIGAKPGAESEIYAQLVAASIEEGLGVPVRLRPGLTQSSAFSLLKAGDIDAFAESAGAGLAQLQRVAAGERDPALQEPDPELLDRLTGEFARRWGVRWLPPLGARSEWMLVLRRTHARALGVGSLSELVALSRGLRCGFDAEFADRADGYRALRRRYDGDVCSSAVHMSRDAMYQALSDGRIDVGSARSTDAKPLRLDLEALDDDRGALRSYPVSLLLSGKTEARFPGAAARLGRLSGKLGTRELRRLVYRVESGSLTPKDAARGFLRDRGLLR